MPRRKGIPSYRFHKARNCAVVTIDGKKYYLGRHESPESYDKYARLIAEWKRKQCRPESTPARGPEGAAASVNELILAFWQHAKQRYIKNGQRRGNGSTDSLASACAGWPDLLSSSESAFGP